MGVPTPCYTLPSKSEFTRTTLLYHSHASVHVSQTASNNDVFQLNSFMNFIDSLMRATCYVYPIIFDLSAPVISD